MNDAGDIYFASTQTLIDLLENIQRSLFGNIYDIVTTAVTSVWVKSLPLNNKGCPEVLLRE